MLEKEQIHSAKERLMMVALKLFAINGFEGTSTRQLAKEADVNISAIPYYFSSKEGLYIATMENLASLMKEGVGKHAEELYRKMSSPDNTNETYLSYLHEFLQGTVLFMLSDKVSPYVVQIFLREQSEPSAAFEIIFEVMRPVQNTLARLLSNLTGLAEGKEELNICAHAIMGQIVVFRTHREVIMRRMRWKEFDADAIEKISRSIIFQTDSIINSYQKLLEPKL